MAAGGTGYVAMDFGVVIRCPGGDSPPWGTLRTMLFTDDRQINEVFLEFFWLHLWILAGRNVAFGSSFA